MWRITRARGTTPREYARNGRRRAGDAPTPCDGRVRGALVDRIARLTDWPRIDVDRAAAEDDYRHLLWWAWRLGALRSDDPPGDVRRWHCVGCGRSVACRDEPPGAHGVCGACEGHGH